MAEGFNTARLPYESEVAKRILNDHSSCVVRFSVPIVKGRKGRGTGFIVHRDARHGLLIMSCSHSFDEWDRTKPVRASLCDDTNVEAQEIFIHSDREVSLFSIDNSNLPNIANYQEVRFSERVPRKGDLVVVLGFPISLPDPVELGSFPGCVSNEPALVGRRINAPRKEHIEFFSFSSSVGPGASGGPVLSPDGEGVGLVFGGSMGACSAVPVKSIKASLEAADRAKGTKLVNRSIQDMLRSCFPAARDESAVAEASSSAAAAAPSAEIKTYQRRRRGGGSDGASGSAAAN